MSQNTEEKKIPENAAAEAVREEKNADSVQKKGIKWWQFLLIWAGAILVLGLVSCVILYRYLDVYEQTRPEAVLDQLIADNSTQELILKAENNVNFELTKYESAEALYEEYISGADSEKPLTYRLDTTEEGSDAETKAESTANGGLKKQRYIVRSGAYNICNVTLEEFGDPVGFGRRKWQLSEIEAADVTKALNGVCVSVDVLPGEEDTFTLNGLPVGEDYTSLTEVPIEDESNSVVERSMDNPPVFHRITIGPLYTDVIVENKDGKVLSCNRDEGGTLYFRASEPKYRQIVEAPEDVEVYINGVLLTKEMSTSVKDDLFEGLEEYVKDAPCKTVTYDIGPLYTEPVVTAKGNGVNTSILPVSEDKVLVFADDGETEDGEMYAAAKDYFTAYMNYSSYSYNGGAFSNLLSKILPGTELYSYVGNSRAAMIWASATKTEYKNLAYENFHQISEDCFVCTISYDADMTASSWYERYSYELKNSYEVVFVKKNDRWYAAVMSVLTN